MKFRSSLGHPSEGNTGLIYMRAGYYDPVTGRFISEDPGKNGGNWFAYADGNPVSLVDRDGRVTSEDVLEAIEMQAELEDAGGFTEGQILQRSEVHFGNNALSFLQRHFQSLGLGNCRLAIGKAMEIFKQGAGMGGADNIGVSKNGIFITDANGNPIGMASDILVAMLEVDL